jgi:hypothetical protein
VFDAQASGCRIQVSAAGLIFERREKVTHHLDVATVASFHGLLAEIGLEGFITADQRGRTTTAEDDCAAWPRADRAVNHLWSWYWDSGDRFRSISDFHGATFSISDRNSSRQVHFLAVACS